MCETADRIEELIPAYVTGSLSDAERASVEHHLASCESCRLAHDDWQHITAAVNADLAARRRQLPPLDALMAMTALPAQTTPNETATPNGQVAGVSGSDPETTNGRSRLRRWLAALLGCVMVAMFLSTYAVWPRGDVPSLRGTTLPTMETGPAMGNVVADGGAIGRYRSAAPIRREGEVSLRAAPAVVPLPRATAEIPQRVVIIEPGVKAEVSVPERPSQNQHESDAETNGADSRGRSADADMPPAPAPVTPAATAAPSPTLPAPALGTGNGSVTGRVTGPDGRWRAEIQVVASALDAIDRQDIVAYSVVSGTYELALPAGSWFVHIEAPAYQLVWHGNRVSPLGMDPLIVAADQHVPNVDFSLMSLPDGSVEGNVMCRDGSPARRAMVVAFPLAPDGAAAQHAGATAFTADDGSYRLHVAPGEYVVGAAASWRHKLEVFWPTAATREQAEAVSVDVTGLVSGIEHVVSGGTSCTEASADTSPDGKAAP